MLRDVTIGQYYSEASGIHGLDPRVKIRYVICMILLLIPDRNPVLYGTLTAVFALALLLSRVPLRHMMKGMTGVALLVIFGSAISAFTTYGRTLFSLGPFTVTEEGVVKTAFLIWRMFLMIGVASLLMYTTTPSELNDGFEKCFHLSGNVAMGITIALRFIPVLLSELNHIMTAQAARGLSKRGGGIRGFIRRMKQLLLPLFQSAFDRAGRLSDAMEARCYRGGKGRTKLHPLRYKGADYAAYLVLLAVIGVSIWMIIRF